MNNSFLNYRYMNIFPESSLFQTPFELSIY